MNEPSQKLIQSYVFHDEKCFFVSTIDRDSSAVYGPARYAETMVWEYDYEKKQRGEFIFQNETIEGSIYKHELICRQLFTSGKFEELGV